MADMYSISRRTAVIGGLSTLAVGCDAPSGGGNTTGGGYPNQQSYTTEEFFEDAELFLTLTARAARVGAFVAGTVRRYEIATILNTVGAFANIGAEVASTINSANQYRSTQATQPASGSIAAPAGVVVNDFDEVPVFGLDVNLELGLLSQGGNFGQNKIFVTVQRTDQMPPKTYQEALGTGELPHAMITPATNGSWDGGLAVRLRRPGAYVYYAWRVPEGQTPSDDLIASRAFLGPAFVAVDRANYSPQLANAIQPGRNVQARYPIAG